MMAPLRVGVIGAGMIAQAAHLPSLLALPERFEVAAIADPSEATRTTVAARYRVPAAYADWRAMIEQERLDAVVICAPHAVHAEATIGALESGLHVFVEKPLCIDPADADRIIAVRERHERVVQVGYMKRFDPAFERMLQELPASADELYFVDVVTHDPLLNKPSLFDPEEIVVGRDLPARVREEGEQSLRLQLQGAVGADDPEQVGPYVTIYLEALIHDVNLVNGLLERMGEPLPVAIESTSFWGDGAGATIAFALASGARWNCTFLWLPGTQAFREHVALYFRDSMRTLTFAAPYLRKYPTIYELDGADGEARQRKVFTSHRVSYCRELEHFHDCIVTGVACRAPAELGKADVELLREVFLRAPEVVPAGGSSQPALAGAREGERQRVALREDDK